MLTNKNSNISFAKEELEEHKQEIFEIIKKHKIEESFKYLSESLDDILDSLHTYEDFTKEEIIDYINYWFNKNE